MQQKDRIDALVKLGDDLRAYISNDEQNYHFSYIDQAVQEAAKYNPWFLKRFTLTALKNISSWLSKDALSSWLSHYNDSQNSMRVALIMAGNLPLVGFHDLLAVLSMGHKAIVKMSSKDEILYPMIKGLLMQYNEAFAQNIEFVQLLPKDFDAVIATGSNNSARYFEYYFGKYPSIIRKNRSSVAIVPENANDEWLQKLADDIFLYFGLGCRSVSKLFLPKGIDIQKLIATFDKYSFLADNYKYFNNYEYNKSILLVNKEKHLDNGFVLFQENEGLSSPVSMLYYEYYESLDALEAKLRFIRNDLQCIVGERMDRVEVGTSQFPTLDDWADEKNVLDFLNETSSVLAK